MAPPGPARARSRPQPSRDRRDARHVGGARAAGPEGARRRGQARGGRSGQRGQGPGRRSAGLRSRARRRWNRCRRRRPPTSATSPRGCSARRSGLCAPDRRRRAATLDPGLSVGAVGRVRRADAPGRAGRASPPSCGASRRRPASRAKQLQAKVAAQQAAAAKAQAQADQQLDEQATAAKDTVKQRGNDEQQRIGGASAAVRKRSRSKQEAAKGASDPSVINARRDAYLREGRGVVGGRARRACAPPRSGASPTCSVSPASRRARTARQAQGEAQRVRGRRTDRGAKIAARPLLDWAAKQALEVDGHVARLSRLAGEEVERHEQEIKDGRGRGARADPRLGRREARRPAQLVGPVVGHDQRLRHRRRWPTTRLGRRSATPRRATRSPSDLTLLTTLRDDMAAGNRDAVLAEMARMSTQERAVVAGLPEARAGATRSARSRPGSWSGSSSIACRSWAKRLEEAAIAELAVGAAEPDRRAADAGLRRRRARARGARPRSRAWGTKEARLFTALGPHADPDRGHAQGLQGRL